MDDGVRVLLLERVLDALVRSEVNEGVALALARGAVADDVDVGDLAALLKGGLDLLVRRLLVEISDVNLTNRHDGASGGRVNQASELGRERRRPGGGSCLSPFPSPHEMLRRLHRSIHTSIFHPRDEYARSIISGALERNGVMLFTKSFCPSAAPATPLFIFE